MNYFEWPCDLFFSHCTAWVILGTCATIVIVVRSAFFVKSTIEDMKN